MVAASGPSLTQEVADLCCGVRLIVVNDAYRLMPWADVLYAADSQWWKVHEGCPGFVGERWMTYVGKLGESRKVLAAQHKINIILGVRESRFSTDPSRICLGKPGSGNSGFQAVNLAGLFGVKRIVLCGFDMRAVDGRQHFFGSHPKSLNPNQNFLAWVASFREAIQTKRQDLEIINATPGSALSFLPFMDLQEALQDARRAA